jgi:hypothetical protein
MDFRMHGATIKKIVGMYLISNVDIDLAELIGKNIYNEYVPFKGKFRT